ncbi:hypothetical protein BTR22_09660 [Alkalihalophilus pseudofirmus]|uniref:hypothetical protein n=1 Tax=Alkalihalophilus pseudofirmus TaxID=79885 RepID=UPI000951226E|nr:hypothetical protein BTR22_09660 [Alkalihalophilus pseudofirmus]
MSRFNSFDSFNDCGCNKHHHHHKPNRRRNVCEGCFCQTFSDRTNVPFRRVRIDNLLFQVGEPTPLPQQGNPNINTITLLGITDDCCATFTVAGGTGGNAFSYTITTDCKEVNIFQLL